MVPPMQNNTTSTHIEYLDSAKYNTNRTTDADIRKTIAELTLSSTVSSESSFFIPGSDGSCQTE